MNSKKLLKKKLSTLVIAALVLVVSVITQTLGGHSTLVQAEQDGQSKLNIVATTTMLFDLAREIGGEDVIVTPLMGPGIDPHLYQASAGDVTKMQNADVVVYNGLHLEGKMGDVFAALAKQNRSVICIEDGLDPAQLLSDEDNPEIYDPHVWFDVQLWKEAANHFAAKLKVIDPEHGQAYDQNLKDYLMQLDELDQYIKTRTEELPKEQQVLVTAHDAFRYFGKAYGFKVMGLQGISTDAEAGTADVSKLAEFIAKNQIKAIFVESSVPPKNIEALQAAVKAKGFEVNIGGELHSDSLGDALSGEDTYILTVKANIDTIVNALK